MNEPKIIGVMAEGAAVMDPVNGDKVIEQMVDALEAAGAKFVPDDAPDSEEDLD